MPNKPESTLINRMGTAEVDWWLLKGYVYSTGEYFGGVAAGNAKRLDVSDAELRPYRHGDSDGALEWRGNTVFGWAREWVDANDATVDCETARVPG
jgi:hypothetical protein